MKIIYPYPMHISNGYTYMLSIIQFLNALAELVPVELLSLDSRDDIKNYLDKVLGVNLNKNLKIVKTSNKKFGIKSNKFFFVQNVIKHLKKFDSEDIVFVSVAGTALHKGWQFLVEATSRLDDGLRSRVKIVIVGNSPTSDIVDQYINQLNMKDNVIFTGFMDDVREAVSIADIGFVLSIGVETISFACREMMAMGKPVLVSDYAGLSENINHHHDGWIVQQKSTSQIQEFLQKIKALDLNQYSDLAKQKAEKEFGLKDFFDKTIKLYRGLECN